jgi:hypothetical protein
MVATSLEFGTQYIFLRKSSSFSQGSTWFQTALFWDTKQEFAATGLSKGNGHVRRTSIQV